MDVHPFVSFLIEMFLSWFSIVVTPLAHFALSKCLSQIICFTISSTVYTLVLAKLLVFTCCFVDYRKLPFSENNQPSFMVSCALASIE